MQQVTVHAAKTNLSRLIDAAMAGEDIIIAKGSRPVVRLVAIPQGRFKIGVLRDQLGSCPDFLGLADEIDPALVGRNPVKAILLDTHAWAWSLAGDSRLSEAAVAALERAESVLVSPISFFEIARKVKLGQWPEMEPYVHQLGPLLTEQGGAVAPLEPQICVTAAMLEWDHRDPYDRMLAATATYYGLPLVSADPIFDGRVPRLVVTPALAAIETPALLLDKARMDSNICP